MSAKTYRSNNDSKAEIVSFRRPNVLLVEGFDDQWLTATLLDDMGLGGEWQVHSMNGKDKDWASSLDVVLSDPPFLANGRSVGLVRDADSDQEAAAQACNAILQGRGLPVPGGIGVAAGDPLNTGVFVIPGGGRKGAVEVLIWDAASEPRKSLAEEFCSDVESQAGPFLHPMKNRVQAYYAAQSDVVDRTTVAVTRADVVDPKHPAFEEYRAFLRELATASA